MIWQRWWDKIYEIFLVPQLEPLQNVLELSQLLQKLFAASAGAILAYAEAVVAFIGVVLVFTTKFPLLEKLYV